VDNSRRREKIQLFPRKRSNLLLPKSCVEMASEDNILGTNQKFKDAVALINQIPPDKFPLILSRILTKIGTKDESMFTETEEEQLCKVFSLGSSDVHAVIDSCAFIFEQSAYFGIGTAGTLGVQLEKAGATIEKIEIFDSAWEEGSKELIARLKNKTVVPMELTKIGWRLHLQVGQSSLSRVKQPTAIFNLQLNSTSEVEKTNSLRFEFTHDQLYDFFTKLEVIQEQLDALG